MKEKLVLVLVFAIMSGSAFAQVQKAQKKRVLLSGVGGAVKMKTPPALTAHSVKLVTGAVRRHLVSPVLMQTRGGKASGAVAEIDRAERGDRIVSAFKKRTTLPHSAYAPQSLNFGPLKVKQSARATITVICPSDGEVSVRYKDKLSQTRVTQLTVFGGDWSSDEPENATPVLVASSTSGRIVAKAGQELRIELEFVSSQTGRIDGTLDITGGDWQATVPTTAAVSLLGPLVGALVLPVERALTGITGTTIEVPMKVLSLSQSTVTARLIPA